MNEIQVLVYMAIWTLLLIAPGTTALLVIGGVSAGVGNREEVPELPAWAGRSNRAHRNMLENLPLFAAMILAAQMADVSNPATVQGAQLFFWGRIAHGVVYIAGIPYVRTLAFAVSIAGMMQIAREVLAAV